jgi:hypothetical protein
MTRTFGFGFAVKIVDVKNAEVSFKMSRHFGKRSIAEDAGLLERTNKHLKNNN